MNVQGDTIELDPMSTDPTQPATSRRNARHANEPSPVTQSTPKGKLDQLLAACCGPRKKDSLGLASTERADATVTAATVLGATSTITEISTRPRPMPKYVDVTDNFTSSIGPDGRQQYNHGDSSKHGLIAKLSDAGVLEFTVRARGGDEAKAKLGGGRDMFVSLMNRVQQDGLIVHSVMGRWVGGFGDDTVNYNEFVENAKTMTSIDAARNTWTGRQAAEFGFTEPRFTKMRVGDESGFGGIVHVYFEKPSTPTSAGV